jgi:organic radical activating enzyme
MSCAEAIGAEAIFIGAHAQDYSGYPDCRPEFYRAFDQVISRGTKAGTQNRQIKIETPIIDKTKAEIIKLGASLGVPFALTWSCYEGAQEPCGKCDSCYYRAKGFQETGLIDPLGLGRRGVEQMLACAESMKGRFLNGRQKQIKARIAEVFCSVQGEGIYLGEEQVFVRFFGCNLSCRFCDTKLNRFAEYEPQELFEEIKLYENKFHSVSFTGGEPLLQKDFLKEVLKLTKKEGHKNYLETNGTLSGELEDVIDYLDIVSMDLKLPSSAGMGNLWGLHRRFFKVASRKDVFVKAIICAATKEEDLKEAVSLIKEVNRSAILVLQPNSFEDYNLARERTESFRDMCIKENVLTCVIPQIHKVVGVQ